MRLHRLLASILVLFGSFITSTAHAGGAITSGTTVAGTLAGPSYLESWTFSGTNGQRVMIAAVTTSGAVTTNIVLKAPGGGVVLNTPSDVTEYQLLATGTFTIEITDLGLNDAGNYSIAFTNLTAGPWNHATDLDGGAIVSADVKTGTMSGAADIDCFTFSGTNGQRVIMDAVTTAGSLNTTILLYAPAGGTWLTYTFADRLEAQLNATGTWIIVIYDNGNDTAGSYSLSFMNVTGGPLENGSDTDGETILSNDIKTGQFQQGVDFDAFTFTGTAGHRMLFTALATGAGTHNPNISIYPPGGGNAEASTSNDLVDLQLAQTGTYTIVVEDFNNDDTGTYTISMMNVTAGPYTNGSDLDGGAIVSADAKTGTMSGVGDIDCFTFSGTNGQRVIMDAVTTAGSLNTTIVLYAPSGATWLTYTFADRLEAQLNATGTWSIVIYDNGYDTAGSYALSFLNVTGGPLENGSDTDGETILSNDIKTGQFQQGVDFDAFTFTGLPNRRYAFVGLATGAGSHNPQLSVYPPGGGAALTSTSNDRFDVLIPSAGTYTLVVEDFGNDNTGTYLISMLNVNSGPFTNGSDPDGGAIASNEIRTGTMSGPGDIDAYQFPGFNGNRVLISAQATAGASYDAMITLFPPGGGSWATYTFADRLEFQLTSSGTWTILIEDNGNDAAGSYTVSMLNATNGPYTTGAETDGGPIVEGVPENGSAISVGDFDGYTFYALTGQTAQLTATKTSGAMDTYMSLYPPGGGNAVAATSNDNIAPVLTASGYYTVVVEDVGQNETGNYTLSLTLNGGPTDIGDGPPPAELALLPASPSPFSQTTRLGFELPSASRVQLRVYDVKGARVRYLVNENWEAGVHSVTWDGRDDRGVRVASGVYYLHLEADGQVRRQKVVLVK